jgi:plasmid replication initiation protein
MNLAARRRVPTRAVILDRSLEELPLFRLSDSGEESSITYGSDSGGRWRVLASPGERLPGTFDQDVYVELMRRFAEANEPADGALTFTLHAFLRAMGRRVDGRTYEQLRGALGRLERTTLESTGSYFDAASGAVADLSFTILSSVLIERRRSADSHQLALFPAVVAAVAGEARVVLSPIVRQNLTAHHTVSLSLNRYLALASPVARRLYRLLEVARAKDMVTWRVDLDRLREQLPLSQRYPSHLQRVLQPAHQMLKETGVVRNAVIRQQQRQWFVDYVLAGKA